MPSTPRKRKSAVTLTSKLVKTSIVVDADLFSRWAAASALKGIPRNAYAVEALEFATKSIVLFDRSKRPDRVMLEDRTSLESDVSSSEENAA